MRFEGEQPDRPGGCALDDGQAIDRSAVTAQQKFDLRGAQMMIKRVRLQGDRSFGLSQRLRASALIGQKTGVIPDYPRVVGTFANQAAESPGRLVGLARAAEHEGEDGAR